MAIQRSRPVAEQVSVLLRDRIRQGQYPPGSRLPSESALAQELNVSRSTVRLSLSRIEALGLIIRKQGDGTYVRKRVVEIDTELHGIWDFRHLIEASGRASSIQTLSVSKRYLTNLETKTLDVGHRDRVLALERLFLADNQPIIFSLNLIPASRLISPQMLSVAGRRLSYETDLPLYAFLKRYCDKPIAYSISDISAVPAPTAVAAHLGILPDQPLLHFNDTFYGDDDEPLAFGLNHYNDKSLRMRVAHAWT
jgi:GntR family transcriptional regulator